MEPSGAEVPEGAAVFPEIPAELGINPLLLAVIHSAVFLSGSDAHIVEPQAADEALQYIGAYLDRLDGAALRQAGEDAECLLRFARQEKWPRQLLEALKNLLDDLGIRRRA